MGNSKSYKTKFVDETVAELLKFSASSDPESLRPEAVNIFNQAHTFSNKRGYSIKDTIFASSIPNAVKMHLIKKGLQKSQEMPSLESIYGLNNMTKIMSSVSIAAIEMKDLDLSNDEIPEDLKQSNAFMHMFNKRDDLILLDLILVVEGVNSNMDEFSAAELAANHSTIVGMPLTHEHMHDEIHGVFYDSELIDLEVIDPISEQKSIKKAVRTKAIFYKHRFPDEADVIIGRATLGTLRFSMECYFEKAKCSVCGEEATSIWDYCDHMWERFDPDSNASRILIGIKFVGGSYVRNPAEKNAVLLDFEDYSDESLLAAASENNVKIMHYSKDGQHITWADDYINDNESSGFDNREGDEFMDRDTLLKNPEVKAMIEDLAKAKAEEMLADMEQSSEKESLQREVDELSEANEGLASKVLELETKISERDALDRANAYVNDLEKSGVDLGSDSDREKLLALFLKSSDEDAKTLAEFLNKNSKADEEESSEEDESVEDESGASDETDETDESEDEENDASDDEDEAAEASGELPVKGGPASREKAIATANRNLRGVAITGLSALTDLFETNKED